MLSRAHDRYLTVMVDENGAARSTDVRARIDETTNIEREKEAALFNCSSGGRRLRIGRTGIGNSKRPAINNIRVAARLAPQ